MYKKQKIAVVVPCYNEAKLIGKVIETMPAFVDMVIVIDDKSQDSTASTVKALQKKHKKVDLIVHQNNQGVGGAIATGYKKARDLGYDIAVVMAGDAQMDPDDLEAVVDPVAQGTCDYTKGNRLFTGDAWNIIPRDRYIGNSILSLLTKIASGYWHIADSQSGYTAINKNALHTINWDHMYKRFGQPNDILVRLNINNFKVQDVPIKPVYNIGEQSGIKPLRMIPKLSKLLLSLFVYRMVQKYMIRDFHPLVFFYLVGLLFFLLGLLLGLYLFVVRIGGHPVAGTSALFSVFLTISGMQLLMFGMWFDMDHNKVLNPSYRS